MRFKISFLLFIACGNLLYGQKLISKAKVSKQPYYKYNIETPTRDTITFYLSEFNQPTKLPLIVFVQGSGSHSLFTKDSIKITPNYGHINLPYISKDKAKVLIVEKPGVEFLAGENSVANNKFNKRFSLQSWSVTIENAIKYVINNETIDSNKILIIGDSEGGVVAAKIANDLKPLITHVAIFAGEGPSQLYSLYFFARSGEFFDNSLRTKTEKERMDSLSFIWTDILQYPSSTDKMFFGYTYLRWYSFLSTSVLDQLANFNGKILICQGSADKSVSPESAVILYTGLLSKGKNVKLTLIENADHSFKDAKGFDEWPDVLNKTVLWFLN